MQVVAALADPVLGHWLAWVFVDHDHDGAVNILGAVTEFITIGIVESIPVQGCIVDGTSHNPVGYVIIYPAAAT